MQQVSDFLKMADFDDILNLISSNQKKSNPSTQVAQLPQYPYFKPLPAQDFQHYSPQKPHVSDSLMRIQYMQRRLNMSPTSLKTQQPAPQASVPAYTYISLAPQLVPYGPPPMSKFASPTLYKFYNTQDLAKNAAIAAPAYYHQEQISYKAPYAVRRPEHVEEQIVYVLQPPSYEYRQPSHEPPKTAVYTPQNRMSMQFNQIYEHNDKDLHDVDYKSISILQRQVQQLNNEKQQLKSRAEAFENQLAKAVYDRNFYASKCEELQKQIDEMSNRATSENYRQLYADSLPKQASSNSPQLDEHAPVDFYREEPVLGGSLYAVQSRFLASQAMPSTNASALNLQPNCFKILPPEGTQLREQAARRHVVVDGGRLTWGRVVENQIKPSGSAQFSEVIHCLFGQDASIFRSKVLAARRAGYCNSIFELIYSGILDQISCKNVGGELSVVLFMTEKILVFEFYDRDAFNSVCKALTDAGL